MNKLPHNSIIVTDIATNNIALTVTSDLLANKLKELGFVENTAYEEEEQLNDGGFLILKIKNDSEKIKIIKILVEQKALFVFGYDWSPSAVMKYLTEQGAHFGKYNVISWNGPNHYEVEEI